MSVKTTGESVSSRRQDWLLVAGVFALTAFVFWPAARWLATIAFAREQLTQSLIIVAAAGAWIGYEKRASLRFDPKLSTVTIGWLFASYLFAAGAVGWGVPWLILVGLVAVAGGLVDFFFGRVAFRRTLPLLAVFAVLILCVLLFPVLDWPLRQMAGVNAARFLKFLGLAPELTVIIEGNLPKLLLRVGRQLFLVATECNGFGLISSSLLLGLIRLLYRDARAPWFFVFLPLCIAVGFVFNLLRIAVIVLLAPRFPDHYHVLHEMAGFAALYAGLGAVWLLTRGRADKSAAPAHPLNPRRGQAKSADS